ncbi:AMP-binding protein, partial [Mesorhizobium mediterraneum]|uniref:AMP-binding protein n=1 Tax=Mesorhizobium mediterraneum TaxID=43617 RepID=UPI00178473D3
VAVPHRAVVRLVCETDYVQFCAADTIGQIASFGFDALTFEIWGALCHGGRIAILKKETVLSPAQLAAAFRRLHVDTIFITAALLNQVAREDPSAFGTLSTVIAGGEALDPHWIRTVLETDPPARLLNGYGPTENTTFTACGLIEAVEPASQSIPIGRPIANTQAYILDDDLQPVAAGVEGWLYASGEGLARGYLGRRDLTADSFLPNPFGSTAGARIYWTGDRARHLPDGRIAFLGRRDDQIKLRGHRIELGEIRAAVQACPGVLDVVVVSREDVPDERYLAAYIVAETS